MEFVHFSYCQHIGLPRAKKDALLNSSLVLRPNVMVTVAILYSKSVRDLVQWSLYAFKRPSVAPF